MNTLARPVDTLTADVVDAPDLRVATGSGRATWDERGNSIWEWQTAPGVYSREISSQQLHALEATELSLAEVAPLEGEVTLWSRNTKQVAQRNKRTPSYSFDTFLKRLGLPA